MRQSRRVRDDFHRADFVVGYCKQQRNLQAALRRNDNTNLAIDKRQFAPLRALRINARSFGDFAGTTNFKSQRRRGESVHAVHYVGIEDLKQALEIAVTRSLKKRFDDGAAALKIIVRAFAHTLHATPRDWRVAARRVENN